MYCERPCYTDSSQCFVCNRLEKGIEFELVPQLFGFFDGPGQKLANQNTLMKQKAENIVTGQYVFLSPTIWGSFC